MIEDRRKYPRRPAFIRLRVATDAGSSVYVTTDISPTGAFLAGSDIPAEGAKVTVIVRPEGMKVAPIEIESVVVRTVQPGMRFQPGFAVRWLVARSDAGGQPLYQVLKRVLRLPEVSLEMFGHGRDAQFVFPDIGGEFEKVLSIDHAPQGPLLQQQRVETRTGPPKAPPPVQTALESIEQTLQERQQDSDTGASSTATGPSTKKKSLRSLRPTSRRKTFGGAGAGRRNTNQSDNILAGTGDLRRQDISDDEELTPSKQLRAPADAPVTSTPAVDDIRVRRIGAVGQTRVEQRLAQAKMGYEQTASVGERSQIFGKSASASSLGGRSMASAIRGGAASEMTEDSISVDVPVTYEMENRFIPARVVQAAPVALELIAEGVLPQLDQNLIINMPVPVEGIFRTINLFGKLLRLPEEKDDEVCFVFHIERVDEGAFTGAYANFLAGDREVAQQRATP